VKFFIFNIFFISLFTGCEIPHTNEDGDVAICNSYNKERGKIILCPQLSKFQLDLGEIYLDKTVVVWFLNIGDYGAFEFQNNILYVSELVHTENNTSYLYFYPIFTGSTKLVINGGDINFTFRVVSN
jgi:hypothetical protein